MLFSTPINLNSLIFQIFFNHLMQTGVSLLTQIEHTSEKTRKRLAPERDERSITNKSQRVGHNSFFAVTDHCNPNRLDLVNYVNSLMPFVNEEQTFTFLKQLDSMSQLFAEYHEEPLVSCLLKLIELCQRNEIKQLKSILFAYYYNSDYFSTQSELTINELLKEFEMRENDLDFALILIKLSSLTNATLYMPELIKRKPILLKLILEHNSSLLSINLSDNELGDYSLNQLIFGLQFNNSLEQLNLSRNGSIEDGWIRLGQSLKTNQSIRSLKLKDNRINNKGVKALATALSVNNTLTELNLESNIIQIEGAEALGEALKRNTGLKHLNLRFNFIEEQGCFSLIRALESNTSLQHLNLSSCDLGEKTLIALSFCLNGKNSTLKHLDLSNNKLCTKIAVELLGQAFEQKMALSHLNLAFTGLNSNMVSYLTHGLGTNSHLKSSNLSRNSLGVLGGASLGRVLEENIHLKELFINYTELEAQNLTVIARQLKTNSTLELLAIGGNPQLFHSETAFTLFKEALMANTSLKSLDLSDNKLTGAQIKALVSSLESSKSLQSLNLSMNSLDSKGLEAILKLIRLNQLHTLILDQLEITPAGMLAIAQALKENHSLSSISLLRNDYNPEVVDALLAALIVNKNLIKLDINHYDLNKEQSEQLSELLVRNQEAQQNLVISVQDNHDDNNNEAQASCSYH